MKRIFIITFISLMSLFLFTGCDQSCKINSAVVVEDGIEYYLETDRCLYALGSSVEILYRLTNKSNMVRLVGDWPNLGARQPVDIIQGAKDIWRVPATPYAETEFYLDPNESCEYTMDWEMETWPEFEPVEPGIYTVLGELREGSVSVSVNILIVNSIDNSVEVCKKECVEELDKCLEKCDDWDPNGSIWICRDSCVFQNVDCILDCELNS